MNSAAVLDREFLPVRAKILEIAATLDRLDRAGERMETDLRVQRIHEALLALIHGGERTEQVQLLFSRSYDDEWLEKFRMTTDE